MPSATRLDPSGRRRPPGRYDSPARSTRAGVVVAAVLFGVVVAALTWSLYDRYGTDDVPVRATGFDVLSDDVVRVEFEATPPDGTTAWCLVRSRDADGREVGRAFVAVPSDGGSTVRASHELRTSARAITGEVPRCLPEPPPAGEPTAGPAAP